MQVTGEQVEAAAALEAGAASPGTPARGAPPPGSPGSPADIRGPHVSLAVRLLQRDAGRSFVLGERLPYVLLAGAAKQDDAAEDPLWALRTRQRPNVLLYWKNKLVRPLSEILGHCLTPARLQVRAQSVEPVVVVDLSLKWVV